MIRQTFKAKIISKEGITAEYSNESLLPECNIIEITVQLYAK